MWVVKLGGSLYRSRHLRDWLAVLAQAGPLVIVPGGGPFADRVRLAQNQWSFDDATAHHMALLAMEQFGHMICGMQRGLMAAADPVEIGRTLEGGGIPVWMPTAMVMADSTIAQSWEVTSDSLAAWLGGKLGAEKLLLVKSLGFDEESLPLDRLEQREFIDIRFGDHLQRSGLEAWTLSHQDHARFTEVYRGETAAATRLITPASLI